MPDSNSVPIKFREFWSEGQPTKFSRDTWVNAGVDAFSQPPSQNPDDCLQMVNVLPPMTRVINRRYGYRLFAPKLDQGVGTNNALGQPGGDQLSNATLQGTGFDGATGYVASTKQVSLSENPTLSIELWFETTASQSGFLVSANGNMDSTPGATQYFGLYITATGKLGFGLWTGSAVSLTGLTTASYNDGFTHHVVITISGGSAVIYVDGVSVLTGTITTGTGSNNVYWRIGGADAPNGTWFSGSNFYQGFISHVSIWQKVLTSAQVLAHYNALAAVGGTQPNYESIVKADGPTYFWYLTESAVRTVPSPSLEPVAQILEQSFHNTANPTVTLSNPTTLNNTLLVIVGNCYAGQPTISDSQGNAYTKVTGINEIYERSFWVYVAPVTNPGSTTITISISSQATYVIVAELRGIAVSGGTVDGALSTNGSNVAVTAPTITTTTTPDRVYSVIFSKYAPTLKSGNNFGLVQAYGNTSFGANLQGYLSLAYTNANTAGAYQCNWTVANSGEWFVGTFGLKLTGVNGGGGSTTTSGTTAFDFADSNNGTYSAAGSYVTASAFASANSGTLTVNTSSIAINPGDTGLLFIVTDPTSTANTVASLTDSNGNTWTALTSGKNFTNGAGRTSFVQVWGCSATVGVPANSSTYTITVTFNNGTTAIFLSFLNIPSLQTFDLQTNATGTSSTPSAGSVSPAQPDLAIAFVAASKTISSVAAPFTEVTGATLSNANMASSIATYFAPAGPVSDSWTLSASGNWADFLLTYTQGSGYSQGEAVVI